MQSVSSDYFDYYFGWENSRMRMGSCSHCVDHPVGKVRLPDRKDLPLHC